MHTVGKLVCVVIGTLSALLGCLGLLLPLLPTTPFLLLSAFCYARGSRRAYHWLLHNRWFGVYLKNYREGRGLSRKHKISALSLLWTGIGSSVLWVVSSWWLALALLGVALGVTLHLVKLPTA